ncbi:MAG: diphosphate--fructose-6-phosphate 1-phosphotransferase [Anaerolineae bacterium]
MVFDSLSPLQKLRKAYCPPIPAILEDLRVLSFSKEVIAPSQRDVTELKSLFPNTLGQPFVRGSKGEARTTKALKVGAVFSGGQAAGGHTVLAGLFDALKALHPRSRLFGFLGGPSGIIDSSYREISLEMLADYRNQGGFDLIGSGRTKIETAHQLRAALACVDNLELSGLVIIGGDDSNTNAAVLAEYFLEMGSKTKVVGVPKTIDGDLRNEWVPISFGFDTACKVYSELIGNIARDVISAKKYTHFIKLMGRSASHVALECALSTHPNIALIGEEVAFHKRKLSEITSELCDVICKRAEQGKNYGVILVPEGLIEFIPEVGALIKELNALFGSSVVKDVREICSALSATSKQCFDSLPEAIQKQLLFDRDPHGNVQVSLIETERLLIETVGKELEERKKQGRFKGKFSGQHHFFGYEGRAAFPSNFDCNYCYSLGQVAALLLDEGLTGYMSAVYNLHRPVKEWQIAGLPLTMLLNLEVRQGKPKPVIQKALVDLNGAAFKRFARERDGWALGDFYRFQGPIQFFGDPSVTESLPHILEVS